MLENPCFLKLSKLLNVNHCMKAVLMCELLWKHRSGEGRQRKSLVSIHVYAAIWLLGKDGRGIR